MKHFFILLCFCLTLTSYAQIKSPPLTEMELRNRVSTLEKELIGAKRILGLLDTTSDQFHGELLSQQSKIKNLSSKLEVKVEDLSSFRFVSPLGYDAKIVKIIKCARSGGSHEVTPFSNPQKFYFHSEKGSSPIKLKTNNLKNETIEEGEDVYQIKYGEFTYDPKLLGQIGIILNTNEAKITKYDEKFNDYKLTLEELNSLDVLIPSSENSTYVSYKLSEDFKNGKFLSDCVYSKAGEFTQIKCQKDNFYYNGLFYKRYRIYHGEVLDVLGEMILKDKRYFIITVYAVGGNKTTTVLVPEFGSRDKVSETLPCQ